MPKKTHGLGRGLDSLFQDMEIEEAGGGGILEIAVGQLDPNPDQPRQTFDDESLAQLAESIRDQGVLQPLLVVPSAGGRYRIVAGERRFRACKLAGMDMIPAFILAASDQGMLEMAIVENIQRQDLDPIEIAMSYQRLMDECHLTQERMAQRVGKKRASVANYLRLLKLPAKVQHDLKAGLLSTGHAKVLLGIEDPHIQELLCDLTIKDGLSVRQLEDKVRRLGKEDVSTSPKIQDLPDDYYRVLEHSGKFFDNSISLKRSPSGKGTMTIRFNSDEEVKRFLNALEESNI